MQTVRLLLILTAALLLAGTETRVGETPSALADANVLTNHAKVQASSFDGVGTVGAPVIKQDSNFTAFSETVNAFDDLNDGRSAEGEAVQVTTVDFTDPLDSTINAVGGATASWTDGDAGDGDDPAGKGTSEFTITFAVTNAASHFSLVGSIAASANAANASCTTVTVTSPDGTTFNVGAPAGCGPSQLSVNDSGELGVGTHSFSVVANALASNPNATGGSAAASFNLSLSLDTAPILDGVEFTQAIQQLQTIEALQADLAGDGKPPVPIVAGKPLAMRVYFNEVDSAQSFTVEVTGEVNQEVDITLTPGCTASDRRKGVNNCESVDFYFTPLEGPWSVQLVVKDFADEVVLDETFNLFSLKTDDVTLKAVSVCDSEGGPGGAWQCQDAFPLMNDASLLRRMFPTADVKVIVTGDVVRRSESSYAATIQWWAQVNRDLDALHTNTDELFGQQGTEIYYYGLVRNDVPGGTYGAAYIDTRGAASRSSALPVGYETIPSTVAHEVGHAMGLDHTNTAAPALSGNAGCWLGTRDNPPPWPYADNRLRSGAAPGQIEVGFDVASGTPLNGEFFYEIMGYCVAPPPPLAPDITRWITPFSTMELLEPAGPLSVSPVQPMAVPASAPGDFWLVQGALDSITQDVALDPLITLELEGSVAPGAGTHRIEVHGGSGLLFTRLFTPAHGHGSPSPGNPVEDMGSAFSELIPVQQGATSIQIFNAQQAQIAAITLGGAAPVVDSITLPVSFTGVQQLSWSVSDSDSTEHAYWVDYSPDGGQTWHSQAMGLTEETLILDFGLLAGSDGQGVFRVRASDGVNSSGAVSAPFTVTGKTPRAEITGPSRTSFRAGELVWLEAAAADIDDGSLDDGSVTWSSSLDGALGNGADLPWYDLSVGTHTITMTAKDSDNNTVTDTVSVTVFDGPIIEGLDNLDINCNGSQDAADALALLMHLSGLNSGSCNTIGSGEPLFGDADCNGTIGLGDVRAVLALAADLPGGCA